MWLRGAEARLAAGTPARFGPPEPLSTGSSRNGTGPSITRRAMDHARTTAITAATSTDQFGPPRVARMPPLWASSASKTRRGLTGASA